MPRRTATYLLADHLLDGHLDAFVAERRANGRSWRHIAGDLWTATGQQVDVTHETLRNWFFNGEAA
jgi:hypothetical protein